MPRSKSRIEELNDEEDRTVIRYKLKERMADKEFQECRRISLIEIAEATGIGRITLSRILNHRSDVRTGTLDRLCAYFGCRLEDIAEYVPNVAAGVLPSFASIRRSTKLPAVKNRRGTNVARSKRPR